MSSKYAFFGLLRDAVRFYPLLDPAKPCKRPNSFLVETKDGGEHLSEPNLGATICDKDKNYFYSRLWEEQGHPEVITFDWPLVSVLLRESPTKKVFSVSPKVSRDMFINVIDVHRGKSTCDGCDCDGCDERTRNEVFEDTERILLYLLRYVGNSAVYTVGGVKYLLNQDHFAYLYAKGQIGEPDHTSYMESGLTTANETANLYPIISGADRLGTAVRIKVEFQECEVYRPDYEVREFNQSLEGCKTCG